MPLKIFGERNTGTHYIADILGKNLDIHILSGSPPWWWKKRFDLQNRSMSAYFLMTRWRNLGWKHSVPSLIDKETAETIVLLVVKNPYSWLLSLHKLLYHNRAAKRLSFPEFIRKPCPRMAVDNVDAQAVLPMELWNIKNRSYCALTDEVEHSFLVRYENVLRHPAKLVLDFANKFGIPHQKIIVLLERGAEAADRGKSFQDYQDFYLKGHWKDRLMPDDISHINEYLDVDLIEKFGYPVL
jgi:hypothetical protein